MRHYGTACLRSHHLGRRKYVHQPHPHLTNLRNLIIVIRPLCKNLSRDIYYADDIYQSSDGEFHLQESGQSYNRWIHWAISRHSLVEFGVSLQRHCSRRYKEERREKREGGGENKERLTLLRRWPIWFQDYVGIVTPISDRPHDRLQLEW